MLKVCGKYTPCRLNSRVPLFVQFCSILKFFTNNSTIYGRYTEKCIKVNCEREFRMKKKLNGDPSRDCFVHNWTLGGEGVTRHASWPTSFWGKSGGQKFCFAKIQSAELLKYKSTNYKNIKYRRERDSHSMPRAPPSCGKTSYIGLERRKANQIAKELQRGLV